MKRRILAFVMVISILIAVLPVVFAVPTAAATVSANADYQYTLTGLPYGLIAQNSEGTVTFAVRTADLAEYDSYYLECTLYNGSSCTGLCRGESCVCHSVL